MDLRVFEEGESIAVGEPIYLKLVRIKKDVLVVACDERGLKFSSGNLVEFLANGKINRIAGVRSDFGFALDKDRKICEE